MKTIVQKFGGSSLATVELRELAVDRILAARARGVTPVVVCSAPGRGNDPYATDALLGLIDGQLGTRSADLLLSCGETIASALVAHRLVARGVHAVAMTGAQAGIVTDSTFGDASIVRVEPRAVREAVAAGTIAVVAGYQGASEDGVVTTLGRGGSDLSAVALGAALNADVVEVYTDVPGIMTADPRVVPEARPVGRAHYAEVTELAGDGAKVMHAAAAELARVTRTAYVVKGLRENFGTTIDETVPAAGGPLVTAITCSYDLALCYVRPDAYQAGAVVRRIFARLATLGVSLDMINVNAAGAFFVVPRAAVPDVRSVLSECGADCRLHERCAKVSLVGAGMRGVAGVASRIMETLSAAGIETLHTTDSHITISVLIAAGDAAAAQRALHAEFALDRTAADVPVLL